MCEMKDSGVEWIGEIPASWSVISTKFLFNVLSGATPESTKAENWDGEIRWITPADYKTNDVYITCGRRNLSQVGFESCSTNMIPAGSIIFSKRAPIGSVAINSVDLCTNQGCLSCVSKGVGLVKYYYYVMSVSTEPYELLGSGTTFKEISAQNFSNFKLPCPKYEDQVAISRYLDIKCSRVDTLIANVQTQIEKLKTYKQSLITEAVTKGLDPTVPMKDSGLPWVSEIPDAWENRKLISILSMRVVDGPHESPELHNEGIPYISATAIENGKINFDLKRGYISEEYCNLCDTRYKPQLGDILVVKLGASTGQVAIVETEERFNIWVPLAAVRCNEEADPYFVFYAFQSGYFKRQMELLWTFGTQQTLGVKTIERLRIFLPSLREQKVIAEYIGRKCRQIDQLIALKQEKIEKMEQYKRSLIYEYVTGKKEA